MKTWLKLGAAGMTLAAATSGLLAQPVPVVPVVPVAPVVPAPVVPLAPVPATPVVTVWAKLGLSKADLAACREKFCASPLGGLIHNMLRPAAALSGGIIGSCCPDVPSAADVARAKAEGPPSAGAAAAIKKDEAEAKKRRADIRYLGTVDCNWWPEAQKALAAGLRADRNECVRLEAALALGSGCCCTPVTIKALSICVAGTKEDGNPRENSDRVRAAAQMALLHCLETFAEVTEEPAKIEQQKERPPERPPEKLPEKVPEPRPLSQAIDGVSDIQLSAFYVKQQSRPRSELVKEARQALAMAETRPMVTTAVPSGSRSVLDILKRSTGSSEGGEVIVNETPALSKEEKHPVLSPVPATQVVKPAVTDRHPATSVVPAAAQERPAAHPGERPGGLIPMLFNRSSNSREATPVATPTVTKAMAPVPSTPKMIMAGPSLEMPPARPMPQAPMNPIQPVSAKLDPEPAQPLFGKPVAEPTAPKSSSYQVVGRQDVQPPKPVVVPAYEPAKPRLVSSDAGTPHWLTVLRDDRAPSKREMAAVKLASTEPAAVGSVVPALLTAMKSDAAPAVRIACIRSLDKLKVCAPEVLVGLDAMLSDADAKVQQEASQALAHLLATPTVTSARPVQGGGPFTR